jgi:hypothetical protein
VRRRNRADLRGRLPRAVAAQPSPSFGTARPRSPPAIRSLGWRSWRGTSAHAGSMRAKGGATPGRSTTRPKRRTDRSRSRAAATRSAWREGSHGCGQASGRGRPRGRTAGRLRGANPARRRRPVASTSTSTGTEDRGRITAHGSRGTDHETRLQLGTVGIWIRHGIGIRHGSPTPTRITDSDHGAPNRTGYRGAAQAHRLASKYRSRRAGRGKRAGRRARG